MKWRFEWIYRFGLAVLLVIAFWSVWAGAQETSAPAAAAMTNPPALLKIKLSAHYESFGLDRIDFLRETPLLGQPLWKYLASLIYIVLAFFVAKLLDFIVNVWLKRWAAKTETKYDDLILELLRGPVKVLAFFVAKLLDFIVNVWLKRWAAKTETKYDDLILELLRGPVKVVAFVVFLNIGLGMFEWPLRAQEFLSRGFIVVVACSVTYVVLKVVDLLLDVWREKTVLAQDKAFAAHLFPLINKVVKAFVIVAAAILTADNLNI